MCLHFVDRRRLDDGRRSDRRSTSQFIITGRLSRSFDGQFYTYSIRKRAHASINPRHQFKAAGPSIGYLTGTHPGVL